jgi:sterol desaturase/sphingolipid hydroxylase (fatty acid hydroxylase superfamily)
MHSPVPQPEKRHDMIANWGQVESCAYWSTFTVAFLGVSVWESVRPRGTLSVPAARRWRNHGLLLVLASLCSMVVLRSTPVLAAMAVQRSPYGLTWLEHVPLFASFALTLLLLDFVKYAVHRLLHSAGFLWRLHQVHHSDPDFEVSTGLRAHPIETVLTQGSALLVILVLRLPPAAVLAAELMSCAQSCFQHANASLPPALEGALRPWLVTPDMHRIHHSMEEVDQRRNLGETFPWWDRLLGTYSPSTATGNEQFPTGLKGANNPGSMRLAFMLATPFKAPREQ